MKKFVSVHDVSDPHQLVDEAISIKKDPFSDSDLGLNKVIGLIFFNASLRTRMSTIRAAYNLGMKVITLNVTSDSWQLEVEDGSIMNQGKAEHIKEAIPVMSSYCDVLAVRSFPGLQSREEDYKDIVINAFVELSDCPVVNLESATLHPLQSLADLMTIKEHTPISRPKIVLTWAPHIKPLPQSVANSFAQWMNAADMDLTITHPKGMELSPEFVGNAKVLTNQVEAFKDADFVYVKNWSSYYDYGKIGDHPEWLINNKKLSVSNQAKLMHCLPVRRNVVIADDAMDSSNSIIQDVAANRLWAAQAVLKQILQGM